MSYIYKPCIKLPESLTEIGVLFKRLFRRPRKSPNLIKGSLEDLSIELLVAAKKLGSFYDFLLVDPYSEHGVRNRGYFIGVFVEGASNNSFILLNDDRHQQSSNTEFPSVVRRLPKVPYIEYLEADLKSIVCKVIEICGLRAHHRPIQIKGHLQRLNASVSHPGVASPNEPHKDDADIVVIIVLKRNNVEGGVNTIYDNDMNELYSISLSDLEFLIFSDVDHFHYVSEIVPINSVLAGYRDVLTLELKLL